MRSRPSVQVLRELDVVEAFCDGCFLDESGVGGWGVRVVRPTRKGPDEILGDASGGVPGAESAIAMEVRAMVGALELLAPCKGRVVIYSDQADLVAVLQRWARGSPAARPHRLIERYPLLRRALRRGRVVTWKWVKSHAGNPHHTAAHTFAKFAARRSARRQARKAAALL